ncbi:hypothetical protein FBU30_010236, partial [Linnemannia zychae]
TVPISESRVIEEYLAARYNRLGKDSYERTQVLAFSASTTALLDHFLSVVVYIQATPEVKQEQMAIFLTKKIPQWIRIHEHHLQANGSNGHYVGDQITLADLKTAMLLDMILRFPTASSLISPEVTPALFKVKSSVDSDPKIKAWRDTELYKSLRASQASPALPLASSIKLNDRKGNLTGGLVPSSLAKEN